MLAFRNYKSSWGKNILWVFIAFYGFSFAIGVESHDSDIVRYVSELKKLHSKDMTMAGALNYYKQSGEIDIVRTTIAISLSRITDSQAILTLVFGSIFGFFFSRNIWYVFRRLEGRLQPITILLLATFFLLIPIWEFNNFRMWTAAHVFIYGLLPYLFEGKKKGILISICSVLIHFSFIVPIGVLLGYLLLGNRLVFYFIFFIATFFISEIDLRLFNDAIETYTPEIFQERTASYRAETRVESFRDKPFFSRNWYAVLYGPALKWSVVSFLVVLFWKGRTFLIENKSWLSLFSFTLLLYGVTNLLSSLPSGGRYFSIANMLALALIILYVQNRKYDVVMKRLIFFTTPALLLYVIVSFRVGLYSMSATAVLGNPVVALFLAGENISLNDVMKMIL